MMVVSVCVDNDKGNTFLGFRSSSQSASFDSVSGARQSRPIRSLWRPSHVTKVRGVLAAVKAVREDGHSEDAGGYGPHQESFAYKSHIFVLKWCLRS